MLQQATRQQMLLEDDVDGLEIELLGQVQHREVFVIEGLVLLGPVAVARDQVAEIVAMGVDVLVLVHGHEAVELDEARIDPPSEARIGPGHGVDHVRFEPGEGLGLGQLVGHRRRQAGVDRRAHEGHGGGPVGVIVRGHQRAGGQDRRSRLADADDVGAGADLAQHGPDVVDIVEEIEPALEHRHLAGVDPVSDIDVVVLQEAFDRSAQQGGVVAGQGGHDQHRRGRRRFARPLQITEVAGEPHQPAPWRGPDHLFGGPHRLVADGDGLQSPCGLAVTARHALEQACRGEGRAADRGVRGRIEGRGPELAGQLGPEPERRRRVIGELVKRIEHGILEAAPPLRGRAP